MARRFEKYRYAGRYPERRYYRYSTVPHVFFSLSLQRDDAGERFHQLRPDLPYFGCLGFFLPRPDERSKRVVLFHHVPFERLQRDLLLLLEPADFYLSSIGERDLPEHLDAVSLFFFDHDTQTGSFTQGYRWM